jgi:hypothetical protein
MLGLVVTFRFLLLHDIEKSPSVVLENLIDALSQNFYDFLLVFHLQASVVKKAVEDFMPEGNALVLVATTISFGQLDDALRILNRSEAQLVPDTDDFC